MTAAICCLSCSLAAIALSPFCIPLDGSNQQRLITFVTPSAAFNRPLHRFIGNSDRLNLDQRFGGVEGRDLDDRVGWIWGCVAKTS
jgi:hypothetical protein